jgi:hypothetical protein
MNLYILVGGVYLIAHFDNSLLKVGIFSLCGLDEDIGELPIRVVNLGVLQKGFRELLLIRGCCLTDALELRIASKS